MNDTGYILPPEGNVKLYYQNGNTRDIIRVIMAADKDNARYVTGFAQSLPGDDLESVCKNIFDWLVDTIPYKEDPDGLQLIKLPGALYSDRLTSKCDDTGCGTGKGGDCKSYSIFVSGVLKNLGIKHYYRFISQDKDEDLHHVYICVPTTGKDYIVIDAVPTAITTGFIPAVFNEEIDFEKHQDRWADMDMPAVSGRIGWSANKKPTANGYATAAGSPSGFTSYATLPPNCILTTETAIVVTNSVTKKRIAGATIVFTYNSKTITYNTNAQGVYVIKQDVLTPTCIADTNGNAQGLIKSTAAGIVVSYPGWPAQSQSITLSARNIIEIALTPAVVPAGSGNTSLHPVGASTPVAASNNTNALPVVSNNNGTTTTAGSNSTIAAVPQGNSSLLLWGGIILLIGGIIAMQ